MRRIINNKRYDTAKSTMLCRYQNTEDSESPDYVSEALYQKKGGEYFLYTQGGPESKYREYAGYNRWRASEGIKPLTYPETLSWAQEHAPEEVMRQITGAAETSPGKSVLGLTLDNSLISELKRKCGIWGRSVSDYITELVLNDPRFHEDL